MCLALSTRWKDSRHVVGCTLAHQHDGFLIVCFASTERTKERKGKKSNCVCCSVLTHHPCYTVYNTLYIDTKHISMQLLQYVWRVRLARFAFSDRCDAKRDESNPNAKPCDAHDKSKLCREIHAARNAEASLKWLTHSIAMLCLPAISLKRIMVSM